MFLLFFWTNLGPGVFMRFFYWRAEVSSTPKKVIRSKRSKNLSISATMSKKRMLLFEVKDGAYNSESYYEFLTKFLNFSEQKKF